MHNWIILLYTQKTLPINYTPIQNKQFEKHAELLRMDYEWTLKTGQGPSGPVLLLAHGTAEEMGEDKQHQN